MLKTIPTLARALSTYPLSFVFAMLLLVAGCSPSKKALTGNQQQAQTSTRLPADAVEEPNVLNVDSSWYKNRLLSYTKEAETCFSKEFITKWDSTTIQEFKSKVSSPKTAREVEPADRMLSSFVYYISKMRQIALELFFNTQVQNDCDSMIILETFAEGEVGTYQMEVYSGNPCEYKSIVLLGSEHDTMTSNKPCDFSQVWAYADTLSAVSKRENFSSSDEWLVLTKVVNKKMDISIILLLTVETLFPLNIED